MYDLISRQAAIDAFHTWFRDGFDEDKWWNSTHVLAAIEGLPSAQPEVIRCKDCKFYEIYELKADNTDDKRYKPSVCVKGRFAVKRSKNWFCADAERRIDE